MSDLSQIDLQEVRKSDGLESSISDRQFKRYLGVVFFITFAAATFLIALNWWIDPLQIFRKASYPPNFSANKRHQSPGLAKHYDYDAVVIGTSVSENFRSSTIKQHLGFNALNFSMQGASSREQSLILQVALQTGKVKNVIWDIQYEYLRGDPKWVANYDGTFPHHFYDKNPLNEVHNYLLNIDTTKSSLKILLERIGLKRHQTQDLEQLLTWDTKRKFGKFAVKKAWDRAVKTRPVLQKQTPEYALANLNNNFDFNYLKLIRQHPEVTFFLYFPPYTPSYHVNLQKASPEIFQNMLKNREYIVDQTRGLKNVHLYDFQIVPPAILDMENFCDAMHFGSKVTDYILESMASERHRAVEARSEDLITFLSGPTTLEWMENLAR